jgi:hypothetical protein
MAATLNRSPGTFTAETAFKARQKQLVGKPRHVFTLAEQVVELHDHGGWNFVEITEFMDREYSTVVSDYHKHWKKQRSHVAELVNAADC